MKRWIVIAALFIVALESFPQGYFQHRRSAFRVAAAGGGGGGAFLINQNFETATTGYDNGETWAETGSTITPADTTAPSPLVGSQSCRFSGTNIRLTSPTYAAQDTIYLRFRARFITLPSSTSIITILGPGVVLDLQASGSMRIGGTVNSTSTVDTYTTGVEYFFELRYTRDLDGGGGSAIYSVEFNTSGTFNGSGNDFAVATTGTDASTTTQFRFHAEAATTVEYNIDQVQMQATPF